MYTFLNLHSTQCTQLSWQQPQPSAVNRSATRAALIQSCGILH